MDMLAMVSMIIKLGGSAALLSIMLSLRQLVKITTKLSGRVEHKLEWIGAKVSEVEVRLDLAYANLNTFVRHGLNAFWEWDLSQDTHFYDRALKFHLGKCLLSRRSRGLRVSHAYVELIKLMIFADIVSTFVSTWPQDLSAVEAKLAKCFELLSFPLEFQEVRDPKHPALVNRIAQRVAECRQAGIFIEAVGDHPYALMA